jgi:hypothetical protein
MPQGNLLNRAFRFLLTVALILVAFAAGWLVASAGVGARVDTASLTDLEREFTERMRDASLVGRFTASGRDDQPPRPDRYHISSVEKVGDDRWRFNTRLRYRDADLTLPVTVTMRWAGDTPMVTLTDFSIPALGTFTARVFFYRDRYAGTWQHGEIGGHMFGTIERQQSSRPGGR